MRAWECMLSFPFRCITVANVLLMNCNLFSFAPVFPKHGLPFLLNAVFLSLLVLLLSSRMIALLYLIFHQSPHEWRTFLLLSFHFACFSRSTFVLFVCLLSLSISLVFWLYEPGLHRGRISWMKVKSALGEEAQSKLEFIQIGKQIAATW